MTVGRRHRNRWTGAGPAGRSNRPVGKSSPGPRASNGGHWYACACGNMTNGRVCSTCDYHDRAHSVVRWCLSCRRPVSGRASRCRRCVRAGESDAAYRLRQQHGWTHNWRYRKNMTGALAVLPPPDSPPPEPTRRKPVLAVQSFRQPYQPFWRAGRRRNPKVSCGCGRKTVGRYCSKCRRLELDAGVHHHCLLCRTPIESRGRRCARCLAVQKVDDSRARHQRDGYAYDAGASANRTGALRFRPGRKRGKGGVARGPAASLLRFRQTLQERDTQQGGHEEPAHRCGDSEWLRVHGAVRATHKTPARGREHCRQCGIYFVVMTRMTRMCPCCLDEV